MAVEKQELTIEIEGKGDFLTADSLVIAIDSIVSLLRSVDANMWRVAAPRYRWRVTRIAMESPVQCTMEAVPTNPDAPEADVVGASLSGLRLLDSDKPRKPRYFGDEGLAVAKRLVSVYRDSVSAIKVYAPGRPEVMPTTRIAHAVERLTEAKAEPYDSYGSVEGLLRRVTVDDRAEHEASDLQIIDRRTDQVVNCNVTPDMAERLGPYIRHRVVVYGMIRYDPQHLPLRINVEAMEAINEQAIPSLEDLHKMKINITGGEDAADFIAHLRGDDD